MVCLATSDRGTLVSLLKERSLQLGDFTLSSGKKSKFYVDARLTTMSANGIEIIGKLGVAMISSAKWRPSAVGGLTLGADPVAYAIAAASRREPPVMDAFTVRKESKGHGARRRIEGCFSKSDHVVVVEDVITTGGSALTAVGLLEEAGGVVLGVLGVVDRMEGGREAIEKAGYSVLTMASIRDLGVEPDSN